MQVSKKTSLNTRLTQKIILRLKELEMPIGSVAKISNTNKAIVLKVLQGIPVSKKDFNATTKILGLNTTGKTVEKANIIRKRRARKKAIKIVSMVQSTSALEEQGIEQAKVNRMIAKTEKEFLEGAYKTKLWK